MAGADIMHLAAEANSRVDPRDAAMMLEAVDAAINWCTLDNFSN